MVFDDGVRRPPEEWQLAVADDLFGGTRELWLIVPEGNGKTTFIAQLGLYGLDYSESPWIPVGAAARQQAHIVYTQAEGFIERTPGLAKRFHAYPGYRKVVSLTNGGEGMKIYAADPNTGDGVIPYPYAFVDELHRHPDLRLYGLWKGKLRKRGGQIVTISTAGEPGSEFEQTRDRIRSRATNRQRDGSFLRATGSGLVLHEYMVPSAAACSDMEAVKAANPLETITPATLQEDFNSPTLDMGDWMRLKCNRPTRSALAAVGEAVWDSAETKDRIPEGEPIWLGADFGWVDDPTALVPLWMPQREYRLFDRVEVLHPPSGDEMLDPMEVREAFERIHERNPIQFVVADVTKAQDTLMWVQNELGVEVVNWTQGTVNESAEYERFMEALRGGASADSRERRESWIRHAGDPVFTQHVMNAITRKIPGDRRVFDRPRHARTSSKQGVRVIDALKAAAMVHAAAVANFYAPKQNNEFAFV